MYIYIIQHKTVICYNGSQKYNYYWLFKQKMKSFKNKNI